MFLISEKYLTDRVNISKQKSASDLKIAFQNVTDFYIKDLLSIPLYDLLLEGAELNDFQTELLEKTKLYFAFMVHYELLFDLFEITNKGNQADGNAPAIELIKLKRSEVMSKADKVKSDILAYLGENKQEFPQYFAVETTVQAASGNSPVVFLDEPKKWLGCKR